MKMEVEMLREYLPFLLPVIVLEIVLAVTALVHILRHDKYRLGNRVLWIILVLVIQIIGPVMYFVWGKEED